MNRGNRPVRLSSVEARIQAPTEEALPLEEPTDEGSSPVEAYSLPPEEGSPVAELPAEASPEEGRSPRPEMGAGGAFEEEGV